MQSIFCNGRLRAAAQGNGVLARTVEEVKDGDAEALPAKVRSLEKVADLVIIDTAALLSDLMLLPAALLRWICS